MPRTAKKKLPALTAEQRRIIKEQPEPSAASLREIPELDLARAKFLGRGAEGVAAALESMRAKRGRPKKGEASPGSTTKSLRLTAAEWAALDQLAARQHTTLHALLQKAVRRELAEGAGAEPPPSARRKRKAG